jgi:hypothetical protein
MEEGTTSRVTAADRPYGKFYDFYSVSLKTFGLTLVYDTFHMSILGPHAECVSGICCLHKLPRRCRQEVALTHMYHSTKLNGIMN